MGLRLPLLFITPRLPARPWIALADLDDWKEMLVRVIVLLVGVTFLGSFVEQANDVPMWDLSVATALVVVAFSLVILVGKLPDWSRAKEADGVGRHSEDATASDRA